MQSYLQYRSFTSQANAFSSSRHDPPPSPSSSDETTAGPSNVETNEKEAKQVGTGTGVGGAEESKRRNGLGERDGHDGSAADSDSFQTVAENIPPSQPVGDVNQASELKEVLELGDGTSKPFEEPAGYQREGQQRSNGGDLEKAEKAGGDRDGKRGKEESGDEKKDEFSVEFAPEDPSNPHNWSKAKKWYVTILVSQIALVVGVAASIDSAAVSYAAMDLGVSQEVADLSTAVYLIGFGLASPFVGPMSEVGGRNPVYIATLLIFSLFEMGVALSPNIQTRVILRFFAGLAGSTPLSNAGGSLADIWSPLERTTAFPIFANAGFLGPVLGPVIGGFIGQSYLGYKWCDWIVFFWGCALTLVVALTVPETFSPVLLKWKASRLRLATSDERYQSPLDRVRARESFGKSFSIAIARPFELLVQEPIVFLVALYMTIIYIILFTDFEAYALIYMPYGLNAGQIGLTFIPIAIGLCFTTLTIPWLKARYERLTEQRGGKLPEPEERLVLVMYGTWLIPISLFWFAWTCYPSISIWPSLVSGVFFGAGILCAFISSYQYIIDAYESMAASALSSLTLLRYVASGGMVLVARPMYNNLGNHWALSLLGFISLAACAIPFLFYAYGKRIRSWSSYAKNHGDEGL